MEQYSYTSTHPLGHSGPVTGSLYLYLYLYLTRVDSSVNAAFYKTRKIITLLNIVMRRITTFRSTTDRIYDGGLIRL